MASNVQLVSIAEEARSRFLRYMVSVVKGRALPDIRDGLKPVHRRILFSMYHDSNLTFDKKQIKCAKIVGDVMGGYHPHGDGALYEALVRMAQEWVMRLPLIHGQGNFGSVDGDPPAAYRYTEAKLTFAAEFLLTELDQQTVPMIPTYDGAKREPTVLPAQFPNLLVNGTSGIAVGLATNIPPHNLGEVLKACMLMIDEPDVTIPKLLEKVKGPDFPLGGKIITDKATLRKIYEEGSGSIKIQGEWKVEDLGKGKQQIVITSIPYNVEKATLENTIGALIEDKKIPQLTSSHNETNEKEGLRIVLEMKAGADANMVMAYLYKHTELQKNFSYNMTAVVPSADGTTMVPRDGLNLKEILRYFLDFRLDVVRKRFEYHLRILQRRIHLLEGFAIIFNALDKAIKIIRNSTGKADAAEKLMAEFTLDEEQTTAILDSQLYKIAQMEIQKILEELAEKRKEAAKIEAILASEKKLWGIIRGEFEKLAEQPFVNRRKTRMASDEDVLEFNEDAYIVRENTNVVLTRDGWVKRVGRLAAIESTRVKEGDEVVAVVPASTLDQVIFFTDDGTAYTMRANEIPASSGYGEPITKFFKMADQVKVIAAMTTDPRFTPADGDDNRPHLVVALSNGYVFRLPFAAYRAESTKSGRKYAKPETGDKVVMVRLVGEETGLMLASKNGHVIHFTLDEVNLLAGVGKGVIGMKLDDTDICLGGALVSDGKRNELNRISLEMDNGKTDDYTPERIKPIARGGKGERVRSRVEFVRVVPQPIELVNWDEIEGKMPKK
ncbi:MAG: DNA gyrase/topoisomerase IV subunit A [Fimbriiglobus sp.]